jgi:glycosyltransferase involved in cell wall biosynthesis
VKKVFRISTVPMSLNILLKGQLAFLNKHFSITAVSGSGKNLEEVKIREGVNVYPISMVREISLIKDLFSLIKLYSYFKKEKPLIVHSITPKAGLLSMLAAKFAKVPIRMHTFTGLIFPTRTGLMQNLLIRMDQILCWAATNVYPEGNGVKQDLIDYKITSKPLKILANGNVNGIDLDYFNPTSFSDHEINLSRNKHNINNDDFVFVFVGRLVGDKGINELIEAFEGIDNKNAKLLLVGSFENELDPLEKETLSTIKTNPNIISVGYQTDVRAYFAISDALAFPSYREGFPNVVMQAGAMGLPSIVTDINGCNEIIEEGTNGIIIPPKDVVALKNAMLEMIENKELYNHLKSNAREMITSRYEQRIVWEALLEEYKRLIDNV